MLKERAIDAGAFSGAAALVVAAWWMAGVLHERGQLRAAAPRPRPTVTVTRVPPIPPASPSPRPGATLVAQRQPATPPQSTSRSPGGSVAPGDRRGAEQTPGPAPTATQSPSCSGRILALGVLGDCALTIGGSR